MRLVAFALALTLGLAACGVDGPPVPPEPEQPRSGVTVTGDVRFGVRGRL